jgi:hypothetical protein
MMTTPVTTDNGEKTDDWKRVKKGVLVGSQMLGSASEKCRASPHHGKLD